MRKADIVIGGEYAVVVGHLRQGTQAGSAGLRRATVLGWTVPKYRTDRPDVMVRLAQPYAPWSSSQGRVDFTIASRAVIATWADHEPAAELREAAELEQRRLADERTARAQAAREELREALPAEVQPSWLADSRFGDGGMVTSEQLLAIVKAMRTANRGTGERRVEEAS